MSGAGELDYDISGIRLRLRRPPPGWPSLMRFWWEDFVCGPGDDPFLDAEVRISGREQGEGTSLTAVLDSSPDDREQARFRMPEGEIFVPRSGRARIDLARGTERQQCYGVMNLLLAALGWRLPEVSGAVLHSAAILMEGRGFLLVGPSGTGKSTWAETAARAGARCLSDDLVFLDAAGESVELLSVPFRRARPVPVPPGRWPLAGLLFAARGDPPRLDPIDRMRARGILAANLLYLTAAQYRGPRVAAIIERLLEAVPLRRLTFSPSASFLPLLGALATGRR